MVDGNTAVRPDRQGVEVPCQLLDIAVARGVLGEVRESQAGVGDRVGSGQSPPVDGWPVGGRTGDSE